MKKTIHLSLAVLAVCAIAATAGAASASATTICSVEQSPCPAGNHINSQEFGFNYAPGTATITTTVLGTVRHVNCNTWGLLSVTGEGEPLPISLNGGLALTNCTEDYSGGSCTAKATGPWTGSLAWSGGYNGNLSFSSSPGWSVTCAVGLDCTYRLGAAPITFEGGHLSYLKATNLPLSKTPNKSGGCPGTEPTFSLSVDGWQAYVTKT